MSIYILLYNPIFIILVRIRSVDRRKVQLTVEFSMVIIIIANYFCTSVARDFKITLPYDFRRILFEITVLSTYYTVL